MLSGALIKLPEGLTIDRLDGVSWKRDTEDLRLRSVIQFEGPIVVDRDTTAQKALAIHQEIVIEPALVEEDGRYSIHSEDRIQTTWAYIYIIPGLAVVDCLANRGFVRDTINNGLNLSVGVQKLYLDTARMVRAHPDQWVRGFSDRRGRVDRGTVFGDGVEQDSVFGPELYRSAKKAIGWITMFFGSPAKVKVSPRGSVILWANPPVGLFLKFLKMEILPYIVI